MRAGWIAALGFAWISSVSCGGSTSGGSGGGGGVANQTDVTELCTAQCDRDTRCGNVNPDCQAKCAGDIAHPEYYRADFLDAYTECIKTLACGTSDDTCVEAAANQVNPNWQEDALYKKCRDRHTACDSFTDDICGGAVYFSATARDTLDHCLNLACDQISDCVDKLQ